MRLLTTTALAFGIAAPASAVQADAAAEAVESDEIIVTARRTEERLQDVPISMTVFNQEQLTDRNVVIASDLATYTPSLAVNQRYGPEKASFAIRGFNQEIGTSPSVGVYFADVVAPRAAGGTISGNSAGAGSYAGWPRQSKQDSGLLRCGTHMLQEQSAGEALQQTLCDLSSTGRAAMSSPPNGT